MRSEVLAIRGVRVGIFCCSERCWALSNDTAELLGTQQDSRGCLHWASGFDRLHLAKLATILHQVIRRGSLRTIKAKLRRRNGPDQWLFYYAEPIGCNVSGRHAVLLHATLLNGEYGEPVYSR
jgi:hypothetical protein